MSKLTRLVDSSPGMGNFSAADLGLKPGAVYESFGFKTAVVRCRKHKEKLVKSYPIPPLFVLRIIGSKACTARPTFPVRVTISPTVLDFHLISISHDSKTAPRHFPLIVFRECTTYLKYRKPSLPCHCDVPFQCSDKEHRRQCLIFALFSC